MLEILILHNRIIFLLQWQDKTFQNGAEFWIILSNILKQSYQI